MNERLHTTSETAAFHAAFDYAFTRVPATLDGFGYALRFAHAYSDLPLPRPKARVFWNDCWRPSRDRRGRAKARVFWNDWNNGGGAQ